MRCGVVDDRTINTCRRLNMMLSIRKMLGIAAVGATFFALSGNVLAETRFQADHPRRAEVNARLDNQSRRINTEVRDGQLSPRQAALLHGEDHEIRTEERAFARADGGHITRGEQALLNRQENGVSRQIGW
jgi:hypothetical protein